MAEGTDAIRQEIEETRGAMTDKLEQIESKVQNTAAEVRNAAVDTVSDITDRFQIDRIVRERPWTMLGLSIAAGYILGNMGGSSQQRNDDRYRHQYRNDDERYDYYRRRYGGTYGYTDNDRRYRYYDQDATPRGSSRDNDGHYHEQRHQQNEFMHDIANRMGFEMDALKEAAIATLSRTVRTTLNETMPQLAEEFERARNRRAEQHGDQNPNESHTNGETSSYRNRPESQTGTTGSVSYNRTEQFEQTP
ncbi:MAG: hypothetical protein HC876_04815 [Chloroflexaceae bacterium]|nr:hypothetical protein [Chloroflexaceae bacterium]